jgi:hypothetical protein
MTTHSGWKKLISNREHYKTQVFYLSANAAPPPPE